MACEGGDANAARLIPLALSGSAGFTGVTVSVGVGGAGISVFEALSLSAICAAAIASASKSSALGAFANSTGGGTGCVGTDSSTFERRAVSLSGSKLVAISLVSLKEFAGD